MAWMALLMTLALPWLSLAISLPAIARFRLDPMGPEILEPGEPGSLWLMGSCGLPMPPFRGKIRLRECLTGACREYKGEQSLSGHCGGIVVTVEKARVCDYLGIFSFRVRKVGEKTIIIRPRPLAVANLPEALTPRLWRPKPGGGYAENHELREFRPGDALNGVHWKLSAKVGSLMVRQPMEPCREPALLTLNLRGSPEALDRKLGRLLWIGRTLLEREMDFEIRALTGQGILSLPVSDSGSLLRGLDTLLCSAPAETGSIRDRDFSAPWQYHIGGEPDEA